MPLEQILECTTGDSIVRVEVSEHTVTIHEIPDSGYLAENLVIIPRHKFDWMIEMYRGAQPITPSNPEPLGSFNAMLNSWPNT